MTAVKIIRCTNPTELFRHYDGQSQAQPAYIELDVRDGTLLADYAAEVGRGKTPSVFHGFERHYRIPVLTGEAANRVMEEIAPLADRILADWEEVWDGNNKVARLGEDAYAAEAEIMAELGCDDDRYKSRFGPDDLVGQWDIDGAVNGCEVEEYGITADTDDARLAEIERLILTDLAGCDGSPVAVCHGLKTHLRKLRDELRQDTEQPA